MAHDYDECRTKILKDVANSFLSLAAYWKGIVTGSITVIVLIGGGVWAAIAQMNNLEATVKVNSQRITTLEMNMKEITDVHEDFKVGLINQRQMIDQEIGLIAEIRHLARERQ